MTKSRSTLSNSFCNNRSFKVFLKHVASIFAAAFAADPVSIAVDCVIITGIVVAAFLLQFVVVFVATVAVVKIIVTVVNVICSCYCYCYGVGTIATVLLLL